MDQKGKAWTPSGGAVISTAEYKFGGASGYFNGNDAWIDTPTSEDLLLDGDFTIDGWIRPEDFSRPFSCIIASGSPSFSSGSFFFMVYGSDRRVGAGYPGANPAVRSSLQLTAGQWYFVELSRSGSALRLFINGNLEATAANSATWDFSATKTMIGSNGWDGVNSRFRGYIDDLRVTKGVARHTASYTPPDRQADL